MPTKDARPAAVTSTGGGWPAADSHTVSPAGGGLHGGHRRGAEAAAVAEVEDRRVEPAQDGRRRDALPSEQAQDVAGQPGDGCGLGALAAHVADRHRPLPVGQVEDVVEVAADIVALAGRGIAGAELDVRHRWQGGGQQRALQRLRDGGALLVEPGVVDGERGAAGEVEQQAGVISGITGAAPREQHPEQATSSDERHGDHFAAGVGERGRQLMCGYERGLLAELADELLRQRVGGVAGEPCTERGGVGLLLVGDGGQVHALLVLGVDGRPGGEARHHELRGERDSQRHVQRSGEQLARLGQQRQRPPVAQLRRVCAVVAQDHTHPVAHQPRQRHPRLVEVVRVADHEGAEHAVPAAQGQDEQATAVTKSLVCAGAGQPTDRVGLRCHAGRIVRGHD